MAKYTSQKLAEIIAAGVAKRQPEIDAVVSKAVATARAKGGIARSVSALNNPRTSTAKADEQAREAARLVMSRGPRMPAPTRAQIESVTQKNASDHESVVGAMRVGRLQRAGKM